MKQTDLQALKQVLSAVETVDSALLLCHVSPDGDTIGSALALKHRLERMGKRVQVALDGIIPEKLRFLPGSDAILLQSESPEPYQAAIAIDVAEDYRLGCRKEAFYSAPITVLIDHHQSSKAYGQYNAVDPLAPATAIQIFRLFGLTGLSLSQEEAICLYTALSTDTGNFIYESTDPEAFDMAGELRAAMPSLENTAKLLFRQKEIPFLRLLGAALKTLRFAADGKIAGMRITQEDLHRCGANDTHRDGLVDYAIDAAGVQLAYLASETENGSIKFSLRSVKGLDVGRLAQGLGGGGHEQAAGVTIRLPMEEAISCIETGFHEMLRSAK